MNQKSLCCGQLTGQMFSRQKWLAIIKGTPSYRRKGQCFLVCRWNHKFVYLFDFKGVQNIFVYFANPKNTDLLVSPGFVKKGKASWRVFRVRTNFPWELFFTAGWENWFENVCGPDLRRTDANSQLFGHFTKTKSAVDARGLWNVHACRRKTFQLSWLGKMVAGSDNDHHAVCFETLVTLQFCCSTCFSCSKSRQGRWDNRHFGQTGWGNDLCCFDKPRCKAHRGVDMRCQCGQEIVTA